MSDAAVLGFLHHTLDPEQRATVERHLDECDECLELVTLASKSSLAAHGVGGGEPRPDDAGAMLLPGTFVGRYEILESLGRGAMGMVYAARDSQLGRRVAIKLVNPAVARDESSQLGLLREAQALARITQPNVLTVHDMGTYDDAVFLAAELVDGDTLDAWLARPRRWRQVVDVFMQAARGLEAAHAAGLVHRDFKPSNAMVGNDGRVRVFDFGVARFVDAAPAGRELAGTPLYMSPEQLRGELADARSDQYALCVALHEALFGEHPIVRSGAARPASRALGRPPGWLRDVIRRGLAPEPGDRFPSLDALRAAVQRGLGRRRRWLTAGVAAVAVAATAVTAGLGYVRGARAPLARCPEPELAAWSVVRRAEVALAVRATALPYAPSVAARVDGVLDQFAGRWKRQQRDACLAFAVHETDDAALRDRRTACLDRDRLAFEAVVDRFTAANRKTVEQATALLGALPEVDLCARADAPAWPADPAARVRFTRHVQETARIRSLAESGQFDAAARDVVALRRDAAALGALGFGRAEADAGFLEGRIAGLRGKFADGAREVEHALWTAQAAGYDEMVVTAACELIALIGNRQRRPDEARRFVDLARATAERIGSLSARTRAARAIGNLEAAAGQYDAAATALNHAYALSESISPPDAVLAAMLLKDLANVDMHRGQHAISESRLRKAGAIVVRELGDTHPTHGQLLNNLGNTLHALARYDESARAFDQALAIFDRALGPEHPDTALTLLNASSAHLARGDLARARAMLERSIAIYERLDPSHPVLASALNNLADLRRIEGARSEAEAMHRRAMAIRRQRLGPSHPDLTQSLLSVATLTLERGNVAEATQLCEEAARSGSPDVAVQAMIIGCQGEVARVTGHSTRAIELFERAVAMCRTAEDPGRLGDAEFSLARALPPSAAPRALELARSARANYEREGAYRREEIAQVDAWLRERDLRR